MIKKIRGVNLGGWLVLEKWMTPELFAGSDALDEYGLLQEMQEKKYEIIKRHRDNFLSEEDFAWIRSYGLNTVRIPIGYWLFSGEEPYIKADEYLTKAFKWAAKHKIMVLLDLHAAPGCQNGFDNGGRQNICEWHKDASNIEKTLIFIDELLNRYREEEALLGIEVLNEPRWDIDLAIIQDFYLKAYRIARKHLKAEQIVVFHDAFRLEAWDDFWTANKLKNVYLDTHMYQVFSKNDAMRNAYQVIEKASIRRYEELQNINKNIKVIVGEWSLGLHKKALTELEEEFTRNVLYSAVGNSLLLTFESQAGWFFWNYKLSKESTEKHPGWSFRNVIEKGYLPAQIKGD